jgi:uncharacterized protein (TIGR00645 family)
MFERLKRLLTGRDEKPMETLQSLIEHIILYSRYFLVVFYVGLAVALIVYAFSFVREVWHVVKLTFASEEDAMVMPILHLIDGSLVSGLIVMVMLSSYENFVGRFGEEALEDSPQWLRRLDPGSLKVKVVTALITISAVRLLQVFMDIDRYETKHVLWMVVIHLVFLVSALFLAYLDKVTVHDSGTGPGGTSTPPSGTPPHH